MFPSMLQYLSLKNRYYSVAFIEGAYILAIELLAAKMMAPVYGASLIIWAAVIGTTLISATSGYFIGGKLSGKTSASRMVFYLLISCGILFAMMPILFYPGVLFSGQFGFITGALAFSMILLFPPLFCISMLSPILIQLIAQRVEISGKISGKIYGISTIGGIFMALLMGFYIIPNWGITQPVIFFSFFIILIDFVFFFESRHLFLSVAFVLIFIFEGIILLKKKIMDTDFYTNIYYSEGILGQLNVIESKNADRTGMRIRSLSLNWMFQSRIENIPPGNSIFGFTHILSAFAGMKPAGSSALVLGFGGGGVAKELTQLGFTIDAVDLDGRLLQIAKDYFYFDARKTNFFVDDARHFIRTTDKKYDVIIIDVILGEIYPSHVFSAESFNELKNILNPNAIILINYTSHINSESGIASRSVYKTLKSSGYWTYSYYKNPEMFADVIYIASLQPVDFYFSENRLNECCRKMISETGFLQKPIVETVIEKKEDLILTDDKPLLDNLNYRNVRKLREGNLEGVKKQIKSGVKVFR